MTKPSHKAVDSAAAKPAELKAKLAQLDAAAKKLANSPDRLDAWAKEHEILGGIVTRAAPSEMARALCEYYRPKAGASTPNPAAALRDIPDVDAYDELKVANKHRKDRGQLQGRLESAVTALHELNTEGVVSDDELSKLSSALLDIRGRIEPPPKQKASVSGGQSTEETMLGASLMALTRAIGYGHGKGQGDEYSAKRAAELVAEIMGLYGFEVSVKRLQNLNSEARK
ncbi:hypothetical protein [Arenimonas daejeonensis]|uniref:hypothetical protein n=1 Tax=Arenimonas daejeonensis TaxID=370777 RepID=UPI0011BE5F8F|nr:hypothetical protein [Arenimonas daejeonensis]